MKVSNIQKGLLVRTMICAVSLAAACFFEASLNVQAAPRAQETELGIDSIPLNALMPIPGTPLEHLPRLTEPEILRTIAFFRYINPEANIRLAAGRALLTQDGETAFRGGASATITGNMLTTVACATIRSDRKMLEDMGRDVTPPWEAANE